MPDEELISLRIPSTALTADWTALCRTRVKSEVSAVVAVDEECSETAAHLVDSVFPHVPVRQWVLSFPHALRYRLAYDASMVTDVLRIFMETIFASLICAVPSENPSGLGWPCFVKGTGETKGKMEKESCAREAMTVNILV